MPNKARMINCLPVLSRKRNESSTVNPEVGTRCRQAVTSLERSPKKMTRSEMASFIRKIAADDFDQTEWNSVMVNHYEDIPTEDARARAVEVYHGHSEVPEGHKTECLTRLADALELPINERDFYLHGGAVGILREFPSSDGEIGYEPYRGDSHYAMQNALKEGKQPICEFMRDGTRCSFTVIGCPSYGHLTIKMNR